MLPCLGSFISHHFTINIFTILPNWYIYKASHWLRAVDLTFHKVLYVSIIVIASLNNLNPSPSQGDILNKLIGASLFMTFAGTLVTPILIAYRIHHVFGHSILQGTRSRFKHVVEILVQSTAVYSLAVLAYAVLNVISVTGSNAEMVNIASNYLGPLYVFIAVCAYDIPSLSLC